MSHHFELEDVPGYLARFPVLTGKMPIARGEYSIVYEGTRSNTVLKLTADSVGYEFATNFGNNEGLCPVVAQWGSIESQDHGTVKLIELEKFHIVDWAEHRDLWFERDAVIAAIRYRVAASERLNDIDECQKRHARAVRELSLCGMFSTAVTSALTHLSDFLHTTTHDVLLDLCNPDNYMTDGKSLIIIDPIIPIH